MAIPEERLLEPKKPFPLEKILTVSLKDWMDSKGVPSAFLSDYELVGIHVEHSTNPGLFSAPQLIQAFAERVPKDTAVVVKYTPSVSGSYRVASGTALLPKVFSEV